MIALLSSILFIATIFIFIGGLFVFIFKYAPYLIDTFNSFINFARSAGDLVPDWLLPWFLVALVVAIFGFFLKVF